MINTLFEILFHIAGRILSTEALFGMFSAPILLVINLAINYSTFGFRNKRLYLLTFCEISVSILYYFCTLYILDEKKYLNILIFLTVLTLFMLYIYLYNYLLNNKINNKIIAIFLVSIVSSFCFYPWYDLETFKRSIIMSIFVTFRTTIILYNIYISYNFLKIKYIKYLIYIINIILLILPTIILPILLEIGMFLDGL